MPKVKVDKELIRELAELLQETGLAEIEWGEGGVQVRVARGGGSAVSVVGPANGAPGGMTAEAPSAPEAADHANHPGAVKSPMVGTVYISPEPGAAPYVKVGDAVSAGQIVLIVEAMKTMNPIPAPRGGRIKLILIDNQQPVEYGQVLMVIE
ncbi:MAG TPA: acetyl-CoA carboxylase biotin carboxyl carrier protein [Candidatus Cybelea sp.]|nr:acetyl-CoA carboxylase biotin carboxyl carrier protein [Candidatus Cybelea sp.]